MPSQMHPRLAHRNHKIKGGMAELYGPLEDEENPCYCPELPAAIYLESLRARLEGLAFSQEDLDNPSFASLLYKTAEEEGLVHLGLIGEDTGAISFSGSHSSTLGSIRSLPRGPHGEHDGISDALVKYPSVKEEPEYPGVPVKRKQHLVSSSFSDLEGPVKRERSIQVVNQSSFDVSDNVDKLVFSSKNGTSSEAANPDVTLVDLSAKLEALEDELYGPDIGSDESLEDLDALIDQLATLLPGLRLQDRLLSIPDLNHQRIADFLGSNGLFNLQILDLLRSANIWQLELTDSAVDAAGLNLSGRDMLRAFIKPNSYATLKIIDLRDTPLRDIDIAYLHHLPALAALLLDDTGIGNEAMYHLVSLRRTLTDLHVRNNPRIDDDAVPALLLLSKLRSLSLYGTSVGMAGLRRFAGTIHEEDRHLDIEIPVACDEYIEDISAKYMIDPRPPLITDPAACASLSVAALRRNLTEHAAYNDAIVAGGTKGEMAERLERILETRRMDLLVRAMVWGENGSGVLEGSGSAG